MKILVISVVIILFKSISFGQSVSNTFTTFDMPTSFNAYDITCYGGISPLVVTLPPGGPWLVTSVDVVYNMTSPVAGGGWMSEQRSRLACPNTGLNELTDAQGVGDMGGIMNYNRTGLSIANGSYPGGTNLMFELQAFRSWEGAAGCNTSVARVDNNTFTVTVNYESETPMTHVYTNTIQGVTTNIQNCVNTAQIIKVEVEMSGTLTPLDLTQLNLTTTGSINLAEISNVNVYYTGNVNSFSNANLFGTVVSGVSMIVNGSQTLEAGVNYFWVEYDLLPPTTIGNALDGTCENVTVNGVVETPLVAAPIGSRSIGICNPSPGGIDNNLTLWLDAKDGVESGGIPAVDSDQVDKWVNKATNPALPDVNQATPVAQPIFEENELNYNPIITFNGNGDKLRNIVLGSDLFDSQNNTIVMVHRFNDGVVYFKWENTIGNRVGFEASGAGLTRFDFPNDNVENRTIGTFLYDPKGQIVSTVSNNNSVLLRNMGEQNILNTAISASLDVTETNEIAIGGNVPAFAQANIEFSEVIVYNRALNSVELNKVESYLAIKYGMTLGVNGTSLNYNSTGGTIVWDVVLNNGFNFDIGGISRDDNSGQDQRKSKSINLNGIDDRDILTVSNGLDFNLPAQFSTDASFLVWGHNDGTLTNTGAAVNYMTDNGENMATIFDRVWKAQETGIVTDVTLEFDMSNSSIQLAGGTTDYNNVRLLVDEDGDFSNGATAYLPTSFDAVNNLVYFQHDFTPTNGNNLTQNNGYFYTLAAIETIVANFEMNDSTICVGETVNFIDLSYTGPTSWNWTMALENGGAIVNTENTQGPHTFTFNTPGTYDIILEVSDANGTDDSTIQLIVSPYPTIDAGLNDTICDGENYIFVATVVEATATVPDWGNGLINGDMVTPTTSTKYYVTSNVAGCESIDSVNVEVVEVPVIDNIPNDFTICEGEDSLLVVTTSTTGATVEWDINNSNNYLASPNITTVYTVTSTLTDGTVVCTSTDQTQVTVNIIPSIDAGSDDAICEGESYTLTAVNVDGAILTWDNGITDGSLFTPIDSLDYSVLAELNGCESSDTVTIDVNPNPELTITSAITICDGEDALLVATSTNTTDIGWDNGVVNNVSFAPVTTTTYTATATITTGATNCTTSESVTVTVNPNPIINADASGITIITLCNGDNYTLTADNPNNAILTWNNGVVDNVTFIPTDSAMYYITANLNGCIGIDSIIVDVVDSPIVQTELDQTICAGDSILLVATSNQSLDTITWDQGVLNNTYIHPISTQTYIATATLGSCFSTDDIIITVVTAPDPDFSFNPNPVSIENTEVTFTQFNINDGEVYNWDFGDNTSAVIDAPIHVYPEVAGAIYVVELTVTDSLGCIDSASLQIKIFDEIIYYIPNAFTPDGDTYNETFQPVFTSGFDPYDYHLLIFNRWGEIIFESFNAEIGWDGTSKGRIVPDGVYSWVVKFGELLNDNKIIDRGTVTLVR